MTKMKAEFQLFLRLRLRNMTARERAGLRRRKSLRSIYPLAIERAYAAFISQHMKTIVLVALDVLQARLPEWMRVSESMFRNDAAEDEIEAFLIGLERALATSSITAETVLYEVQRTAEKILVFEKNLVQRQTEAVLGMPMDTGSSWWPEARKLWENENHRLIKSLSQEYITKLNTMLTTGFQSGWSYEEMVDGIMKLSDKMTGYRARTIARDQVGKLNYAIARKQFESIGMDGYIWTTARDERVRGNPLGIYPKAIPSHWDIDGKICKFSDPTVYSDDGYTWKLRTPIMPGVHPGQAIMCRCTASPYWLPLIREAEKNI